MRDEGSAWVYGDSSAFSGLMKSQQTFSLLADLMALHKQEVKTKVEL